MSNPYALWISMLFIIFVYWIGFAAGVIMIKTKHRKLLNPKKRSNEKRR